MAEFQVLDPVLLRLPASALPSTADGEEEQHQALEGVVALIDLSGKRIGVRLTGSSVGKGNVSGKMGDLQCPPNGGVFVDMPDASTKERVIRKRPVTRLDELRLRRELGIMSSASTSAVTTSTTGATSSSRGATDAINRSRIRRRQDTDAAAGGEASQRDVTATASSRAIADPPETFRLPPPTETTYSSSKNEWEGESDSKPPEFRTNPLNEISSSAPPTLEQLQKELAELPDQVKSTQERLEKIKQQKEQRFQQHKQQTKEKEVAPPQTEKNPEESPQEQSKEAESPPEPPEQDQVQAVEPPIRRSDPPGISSDVVAIQRPRPWSQANEPASVGNQVMAQADNVDDEVSAATTSATESNTDVSVDDAEDFMIGQSAEVPRVEAITDLSSSLPLSPLEKTEAKNNPDLANRMNVSNCSSIGQEVSEVSFFLQSNAPVLQQGLNGEDRPFNLNLFSLMEASQSSAEKSEKSEPNETSQQSSEGMEQVLDPWDRILLQSKGMMELDKPETVLQAALPEPVAAVADPWAHLTNTSVQSTSSILDVSNPYNPMAPMPIPIPMPIPMPSPDRTKQESQSAKTPLRSNMSEGRTIEESPEHTMGEMMKYILATKQQQIAEAEEAVRKKAEQKAAEEEALRKSLQQAAETKEALQRKTEQAAAAEEASQKSTTSFNSLDNKSTNRKYAKAASQALPVHTTESTFSNLKTSQLNESSDSTGVVMGHLRNREQERFEEELNQSTTSFNSMDNKSMNRKYAKAASAALPTHTTEATFADLLRKAERRSTRTMQHSVQSKPSFDDNATMVSVGLESTTLVQFDEKKEEESQSSSKDKETPFSELKPLAIKGERRSFGGSKPWSKVLNRLTDDVKAEPVKPTRAEESDKPARPSIGTFSENSDSPARSIDSYSTSSLPKPPGYRTPFEEDPGLFPLDEGGVSLGTTPIKGLEFNALMPLMAAFNDNSIMPTFGKPTRVIPPDFDENSVFEDSVKTNGAVRTPKKARSISSENQPASPFGNGTYSTPPRTTSVLSPGTLSSVSTPPRIKSPLSPGTLSSVSTPPRIKSPLYSGGTLSSLSIPPRTKSALSPGGPLSSVDVSGGSLLETSSITNEAAPTPLGRTNAFGSPIKSPLENSVFTNGPVSTPTRLPNKHQKPSNPRQDMFRKKPGQENKFPGGLDSSDDTPSPLIATVNSLYSHDHRADDNKDAESFSSYAWTAQASVNSETKSNDNSVLLTGTFDVESQASTPSKIPRITLDDSFSLYSHVEDPEDKSPKFLQLDMATQIKEIVRNTRAKREQTKTETTYETTKIVAISPLKKPDEDYDSDNQSFVSSSSDENNSIKESPVEDEFFLEAPKKTVDPRRQKLIRCLAIFAAMLIGATAAVLYGVGVLDLETGNSQRSSTLDGGTSVPTEPRFESLTDRLDIQDFDLVLAHIQASLDWISNNDSTEFINSLEQWQLDERYALVALYMATNPESSDGEVFWKDTLGFLTPNVSVCQWNLDGHGVFCDDEGHVTEISLDENGLFGVLPKELGRVRMMENLSLASNRITGSLPKSLFQLEHLYSMILSDNQLTGGIPESRNEELQILNLSHNYKLTGQIPESLTQISSLKHLALYGTNIIGTIPEFANDSNLEFVAIADSRIGGSIPSSLTTLPNLRYLYLMENSLSGTVPTHYSSENIFSSGNGLRHLYLSGNQLSGQIPSELMDLTRLKHLGLDFNSLTGVLPTELASLDSLEYLYLNSNVNFEGDLSDFELQPLLARLKELQIQNTAVLLTEDSLCSSGGTTYEWDFVSSDCKPPTNRVICSCCNVCCPDNAPDSENVCLSFNPSGKTILENTVW